MSAPKLEEIEFHPTSFCDGNGRVFWWKGELYRGITEKCAEFTRRIFAEGIVDDLIAQNFIPRTELTDTALPGFALVVRHERLPFVSYAYEWPPAMLREAGLCAIQLLRHLAGRGLTLTDVAPWNILFAGARPFFVDFSSIIEMGSDQDVLVAQFERDFRYYYLRSLELSSQGHGRLARLLLTEYDQEPIAESFTAVTQNGHPGSRLYERGANALLRRVRPLQAPRALAAADPTSHFMQRLARLEERFGLFAFDTPAAHPTPPALARTLEAETPASLLLVESGTGQAARPGLHLVALERDEARANAIYQQSRAAKTDVLTLVVDLAAPAPGYGVGNNVLAPALQRLPCEIVAALGTLPSLVFERRLRFEQIADTLARLTLRKLLVDFPAALAAEARDPYFAWCTCEGFRAALQKHFRTIQSEASNDGATLFICEK